MADHVRLHSVPLLERSLWSSSSTMAQGLYSSPRFSPFLAIALRSPGSSIVKPPAANSVIKGNPSHGQGPSRAIHCLSIGYRLSEGSRVAEKGRGDKSSFSAGSTGVDCAHARGNDGPDFRTNLRTIAHSNPGDLGVHASCGLAALATIPLTG